MEKAQKELSMHDYTWSYDENRRRIQKTDKTDKTPELSNDYCSWRHDEDDDSYWTSCKKHWMFLEGTAADNGVKYCPFCGKKVVEVQKVVEDE